jgi:hypothetical protein
MPTFGDSVKLTKRVIPVAMRRSVRAGRQGGRPVSFAPILLRFALHGWCRSGPIHARNVRRVRIADEMIKNKLPSIYSYHEHVRAGGLMTYTTNYYDVFRRQGLFIDKIFKGAKPGDLPVQQPTKFELMLNLKTAKALGLEISPAMLALADEVIE